MSAPGGVLPALAEIESKLLGPGGPFETTQDTVLGEPMAVFKDRPRSLAEILAGSRSHGDAEYLVCDGVRLSFEEHARRVARLAKGTAFEPALRSVENLLSCVERGLSAQRELNSTVRKAS